VIHQKPHIEHAVLHAQLGQGGSKRRSLPKVFER